MKRLSITLLLLLLVSATLVQAQRSTERYIPLGQSPGLSGKVTLIGLVATVDSAGSSLALQTPTGPRRFQLDDKTRLWLDQSAAKQPTLVATMADLRVGRRVEIKFGDGNNSGLAEWIKIDAATPP